MEKYNFTQWLKARALENATSLVGDRFLKSWTDFYLVSIV